jgi:hypothetical protein
MDLRYDTPLQDTGICGVMPGKGDLGVAGALLLDPDQPMDSVMWLRMEAPAGDAKTGDLGRMPAIASFVVDPQGTNLISDWIKFITACPQ